MALAIDANMAEAWASLAYLKRDESDWAGAKIAIDKAMMLQPNNAFVLGTAATVASTFGQLEKSVELFERDVELDPLGLAGLRALGIRYADVGRFEEALETFNRVMAMNPEFPGIHMNLGVTYLWMGDAEMALIEINKSQSSQSYAMQKARILSTLGREKEAQSVIRELLEGPTDLYPLAMAATFAWRGENDLAFEWFEKARLQNSSSFSGFLKATWKRNLVNDPRYAIFVEKIGLLEYWKAMPPKYGGPAQSL